MVNRIVSQNELNRVLELHKKWLNGASDGARASLGFKDLRGANLHGVDLHEANLYEANLCGANLCGTNLYKANLYGAILRGTMLCGADLRGADLREADFCGANLCDADFSGADLRGVRLYGADLREAKSIPFIPMACPEIGSYIAFKKADGHIVVLEIPEDALRSSATTRKCRASKARVLRIENLDGSISHVQAVHSYYDSTFIYKVGKTVEIRDFNTDRWDECSTGIHHFMSRQEAAEYNY